MRKWRWYVLAVSGALIVGLIAFSTLVRLDELVQAQGMVEPLDFVDIRAPMNLLLKDILCEEYQYVKAGQPLALLEDYELKHEVESAHDQVEQAKAAVDRARAELRMLESSPRPEELRLAKEECQQARLKLMVQQSKLQRVEGLYAKKYASQEDLEEVKMLYQIAESEYAAAQARLELVERGPTPDELAAGRFGALEAEASYAETQESLAKAQEQLSQTVLTAPRDGMVSMIRQRVGYMLNAGDLVIALAGGEDKVLRVWVREDDVVKVRLGQKVDVESQLYRHRRDRAMGEVIKIDPFGEARRGQQHYEVKVKITREPAPLKLGSSAWASIRVGRRTILGMIRGTGERFGAISGGSDQP